MGACLNKPLVALLDVYPNKSLAALLCVCPIAVLLGGESLVGRELAVEQVEHEPAAEQTEFESAVFLVNMESLLSHQRRYRTNSEEGNSYNREF